MVEAWKARRENPIELGLGLLDLAGICTPSRRQAAAAITIMDALTRINTYYPTPQQARELTRKPSRRGRRR